jgi:hypothetical protein
MELSELRLLQLELNTSQVPNIQRSPVLRASILDSTQKAPIIVEKFFRTGARHDGAHL